MSNNPLSANKKKIVDRWIDLSLKIYPSETQQFFRKKGDRFGNPVGSSLADGLASLMDWLLSESVALDEEAAKKLDQIVRIRAVQEISAQDAVSFVFLAKRSAREAIPEKLKREVDYEVFDAKVDKLALHTFENFLKCREKIYELKTNELKRNTSRLMQRFTGSYWTHKDDGSPED